MAGSIVGGLRVSSPSLCWFGAVAGGAIVLAAPVLAILGVIAAFFAKVTVEIVREKTDEEVSEETDASAPVD